MVSYIVDDQDDDITYLCPSTPTKDASMYYGDTWSTIVNSSCADGWFMYTFKGVGVQVSAGLSETTSDAYSISLDGAAFESQTGNGFYETGMLADQQHTIMYGTGSMSLLPTFDYITVMAGNTTNMRGRAVIVDDKSEAIDYSAEGWSSANVDSEYMFYYGRGAYQDTVHWTRDVGASLSFQFLGSSVMLYAILPPSDQGDLTLQYEVDGNFVSAHVLSNPETRPVSMFRLFSATMTEDGSHNVTVVVTNVQSNYSIGFDFVTYNASFDRISEIPAYFDLPPSSGSTGGTTGPNGTHKRTHVDAIVGGVIGGLVFIGLVTLVLSIVRRRQKQKESSRAAAAVIGRNYNPQLDVKSIPRPEAYPMVSVSS